MVRDNVDVAGMPTMRGTDTWTARPADLDSEFTQLNLATGMTAVGEKTQMSEYRIHRLGRTPATRPGLHSLEYRPHRGRVVVGLRRLCAAGAVLTFIKLVRT